MRPIDAIRRIFTGEAPPPPVQALVGFEGVSLDPERAVFELSAGARHLNPMGTLHGGILCDLADAAMGCAMATTLEEGESYTTLELKINFLKPVREARLRATGHVVKRTRTIGLLECDVVDAGGSLVARASSTCLVLRGEAAAGR